MGAGSTDPRVIDVLVVTAEDVISAFEARRQRGRPVVLRVTPPFSGRMRARIHVAGDGPNPTSDGVSGTNDGADAMDNGIDATNGGAGSTENRPNARTGDSERDVAPLHVPPETFVADAAPEYPRPADTEDALRADPDVEYTVERHHDRHAEAVSSWRDLVRDHFVDETTVETDRGPVDVDVVVLG